MTLDMPSSQYSRSKAQQVRNTLAHLLKSPAYCSSVRLPCGEHVWRVRVLPEHRTIQAA